MKDYHVIIFTMCFTVALSARCDEGWRFSPHSKKCFKYFPTAVTWSEAEFHCRMQNSYQLSIHSERENRFVKEIIRDAPHIWLGSAKFGRMSTYKWSDSTTFNFRGWKNGQLPITKLIQPCTKMNVTNGEWFQSCCRIVSPYICQKDPQHNRPYNNNIQNDYDTTQTDRYPVLNQRRRLIQLK